MSNKMTGMENRYTVTRNGDSDDKHVECEYFVLDLTHDPIARQALMAYAELADDEGFNILAADLYATVDRIANRS